MKLSKTIIKHVEKIIIYNFLLSIFLLQNCKLRRIYGQGEKAGFKLYRNGHLNESLQILARPNLLVNNSRLPGP